MNNLLTLSDVLGRSVSVDWHEGVALVRGVVERLLERPSEPPVVPELHQIQLSPIGRIDVIGGTTSNDSVRRLGQLLQAILGHSEPPVQLRLFVAQATAPTPAFGSIREYDAALAFFERPGRDTVLQTLYARAAATPPASDSTSKPTLDAIAPLPTAERPKDAQRRSAAKSKPRASRLVAGSVVLLVVCTACVLYGRSARHVSGARDVSTIALQTSDAVGSAIVSGLSAVTERVGLGRLVSADAPSVAPPPAVGALPPRASRVNRAATQLTPQVPLVAFDLRIVHGHSRTDGNRSLRSRADSSGERAFGRQGRNGRGAGDLFTSVGRSVAPRGRTAASPAGAAIEREPRPSVSHRIGSFDGRHGGLGQAPERSPKRSRLHVPECGQGVAVPARVEGRPSSQVPEDGLDFDSVTTGSQKLR